MQQQQLSSTDREAPGWAGRAAAVTPLYRPWLVRSMQMLACALLLLARTAAAWNGLAVTPPMVSTLMCTRPLPLAAASPSRLE